MTPHVEAKPCTTTKVPVEGGFAAGGLLGGRAVLGGGGLAGGGPGTGVQLRGKDA